MLTIEYAKDPVYSSPDLQTIELIVKFVEFSEEMPFGATPFDPMPYGVELYNNALAGNYGPIAPYVPPLEEA
jgi:hypothetical protein